MWGVFLFIIYFGREALHHRNEPAGRAVLDILIFIAACGQQRSSAMSGNANASVKQ